MTADPRWRIRATRYLYQSKWFDLRQDDITLPGGDDITYTFVEHPGYAMVLPITRLDEAVMVDVYRHPLKKTSFECPAGGLDGNSPETTAIRELEEETGYVASELLPLGSFDGGPGSSNENFSLFLAPNVVPGGKVAHENTEQITVRLVPIADLVADALAGKLDGGPTTLCVLLAAASGHLDVSLSTRRRSAG